MSAAVSSTVREELATAAVSVRAGEEIDAVDGVRPEAVATVDGTESAAATMRIAAAYGLRVVARGGGNALDQGNPPSGVDLLLDVSPADGVLEHAAGDLVVRAQAGARLAGVREVLATADQQLALDQPVPVSGGPTLGGIIATGASGPGRHFYGSVRDLLIGITVVRADGTVAASGGKVVKNVAGYDLGKLYTGSYGTLGVITEVIFRLHPIAPEACWVSATAETETAAADAVRVARRSQVVPTAIELERPGPDSPITVCTRLDGMPAATRQRGEQLAGDIGAVTGEPAVHDGPPLWWGEHPAGDTIVRLSAEPAALGELLSGVREAARRTGLVVTARGSAGMGVLCVGVPAGAAADDVAALLVRLREVTAGFGGAAVVQRAPREIKASLDVWGPVDPGARKLMRRIKDEFDPDHRLAPGRFAGGI